MSVKGVDNRGGTIGIHPSHETDLESEIGDPKGLMGSGSYMTFPSSNHKTEQSTQLNRFGETGGPEGLIKE